MSDGIVVWRAWVFWPENKLVQWMLAGSIALDAGNYNFFPDTFVI
jgi:hypothetical protein